MDNTSHSLFMKLCPPAGVRLCLGLSLLAVTSQASAKEEWLPLLPEQTVAVLSIKNTPELVADWDGSSIGRFIVDPDVAKWMAPMYEDGLAPWDKVMQETAGTNFREQISNYPGASLTAFLMPEEELGGSEPLYLSLSELGDKKAAIAESLDKQAAKKLESDSELKAGEEEIEGVTIKFVGEGEGEDAYWAFAWADVEGVLVESNDRTALLETITALQKCAGAASPGLSSNFKRFQEIAEGDGDVMIYVDAGALLEKLKESMAPADAGAGAGAGAMANPFSAEVVMGALHLDEILGLGVSIDLQDGSSRVDAALLHKPKPQGLIVKLMHGSDTQVELPNFVPVDVASASVTRWSFLNLYDGLMAALNQFGPMVGGMVQMQMGQMEQQMGIKLRDDLFATTDDEIVQVSTVAQGDGAPGQVTGIKLKDSQRFGAALEVLKKMAGNGFGVFEESEFAGVKVYKIKANLAGPQEGGAENEMAYALTKDYLLFSNGSSEALNKVLTSMANPGSPAFWDEASVKEALAALPANATGLGVSDGSALVKSLLTTLMTAQETMASKLGAKDKAKAKPKGGDKAETEADSKWFDPKATPSDEVFARYFGKSSTGSYSLEDASHYRIISQPVEAQ